MVISRRRFPLVNGSARAILVLGLVSGATYCDNHSLGTKYSYREIGDMYMRSFGLDKETTQAPHVDDEAQNEKFQPLQLTEHEKRGLIFNLLARKEEKENISNDKLLKIALEDLEVFYAPGRNYESTLFAHLNHTRTVFGQAVLAKILANPTIDQDVLKKRQDFIKELIDNESLFNELDALVCRVHTAEENILSFWKNETSVTKSAIDKLYFGTGLLKSLNTSSLALETKVRMRNLLTTLGMSAEFLTLVAMGYFPPKIAKLTLSFVENGSNIKLPPAPTLWQTTKGACTTIWSFYNPKKWFYRFSHPYRELAGDIIATQEELSHGNALDHDYVESLREGTPQQNKWSTVFWGAGFAAVGAYTAFQYYNKKRLISSEVQANNLQLYLQHRLIGMANLVESVKQLQSFASTHKEMHDALGSLTISLAFFNENNKSVSIPARKLVNLLSCGTFKGNASFFSLTGRVLSAYQLMGSAKDELICMMETIGELDAYLSIAKLYKKHLALPARYCFAEYRSSDKPYIHGQGFWNALLDSHKAIPNNIVLGGDDNVRNAIITGSNTGGKSTGLKAVAINVLLAQTVGIVPAKSFIITPFEVISTSLNIKDDTVGGNSRFKAEVLRSKQLIEAVKNLVHGQFAFYVIDELCTGTSPEKGQACAYQVATNLCNSKQLIYLWATHYPRLTKLEESTNGVCKNFKMEAYKNKETGEVIRPFKLEEGISTSNIATDILESELDSNDEFLAEQ